MKPRILIIDDEVNIRRMGRLALETAGYDVAEAGHGEEGLEIYAADSNWDVILLDQRMPGIDGLETLRRLKERDTKARVIMITAYASIELAVDAMKLGATDFVRKPMTPEILRGAVAAAVAKKSRSARSARSDRAPVAAPLSRGTAPQIETITLNGFEIVVPTEADAVKKHPDEHAFIVSSPEGVRSQVTVKIDGEAVAFVERIAKRRLDPDNSFWALAAERLLSDYLWDNGRIPPGGKLTLKEIDREQMLTAERWTA